MSERESQSVSDWFDSRLIITPSFDWASVLTMNALESTELI